MIQVSGIDELTARLKAYRKQVSDPKVKTRIMAAGGQVVKRKAATLAPKSRKDHKYYPKKGSPVTIFSGNLKKSMRVYRGREGDVYVGPHFMRRVTGDIGATAKTASGYYAAALFKSAAAFRRDIMEAAAAQASAKVFNAVEKAYARFHDQNAPK